MKNQTLFSVSEEHIGPHADPEDAHRVVELLRAEGWNVVYGDAPWQFESEEQRDALNNAFQWAVEVVQIEHAGIQEVPTLRRLVRRRIEMNSRLRPYEAELLAEPRRVDYWQWLLTRPTDVILEWLLTGKKESAPGK